LVWGRSGGRKNDEESEALGESTEKVSKLGAHADRGGTETVTREKIGRWKRDSKGGSRRNKGGRNFVT